MLSEALKSNSSLTSLTLSCNTYYCILYSLNVAAKIGPNGALYLSEAIKLNSSLTSLDLSSTSYCFIFILTQYR